ncbi:MAG: response regulator [bacterium]|nr:response regulator [bacterium]
MKILLFDNNIDFGKSLKESLKDRGEIFIADTCFTTKERLIHNSFDVILSQMTNAEGDKCGIDFLKTIKASGIKTPIIMLASDSDIPLAVECLKFGAFDVIEKTGGVEAFIPKVANVIDTISTTVNSNEKSRIAGAVPRILFVDDDRILSKSLKMYFSKNYQVDVLNDFSGVKELVSREKYNFIFLDIKDEINMDEKAGVKQLKIIMDIDQDTPVIMLSGWADTAIAVECLKLGAYDFLEKSVKIPETIEKIETTFAKYDNEKKKDSIGQINKINKSRYRLIDVAGECGKMKNTRSEIINVAAFDVPVLIFGNTGTGKEMVASAIHVAGSRRNNNFVEINCGSIPESIFESELFGYAKGAFTGASKDHTGKMELAHGGTLFLDEIENLSLEQQAKLLRVMEDNKIYPLGSSEEKIVDFRLICATNIDLHELVEAGRFREDLYYRLNVYKINLPSLRERGEEDIALLVKHFLNKNGNFFIDDDALELLQKYTWPGNVRELKNLLNRFTVIAGNDGGNAISFEIVKEGFKKSKTINRLNRVLVELLEYSSGNIAEIVRRIEDMAVLGAFHEYNGNISKIAQVVFKENPEDNKNHRDKVRAILERNKHLLE